MIGGAPHVWVPRRNPLWYPGFVDGQGHRLQRLDDIAGKPLDPSEYAALLAEIRSCSTRVAPGLRAAPGLRLAAGDGSFTPLDVDGQALWLDMQDSSAYTTASGAVSAWVNKVTNFTWSEGTAANRAAFSATGFQGFPCLDFDGSNDRYVSTEASVVAAVSERTICAVIYAAKHDVADAAEGVLGYGNFASGSPNSSAWYGVNTTGAGCWVAARASAAGVSSNRSSTSGSDTGYHVFDWWNTSQLTSLSVDNAAPDPDASMHTSTWSTVAPDQVAIGCCPRNPFTAFLNGRVGELLLYAGEVSASGHKLARQYLAAKWGVTLAP